MSFSGYKMMFPIIRIKDKQSGHVHIVGTDSHDSLYVGNDGQLHYHNLQNSDGSGGEGYGYVFEGVNNEYFPNPTVKFVTLDGLLEIIKGQAELSAEQERTLRELVKELYGKYDDEVQQSQNEGFTHT